MHYRMMFFMGLLALAAVRASSAGGAETGWNFWVPSAEVELELTELDEEGDQLAVLQTPDGTPVTPVRRDILGTTAKMLHPMYLVNTALDAMFPSVNPPPPTKITGAKKRSWRSKIIPAKK